MYIWNDFTKIEDRKGTGQRKKRKLVVVKNFQKKFQEYNQILFESWEYLEAQLYKIPPWEFRSYLYDPSSGISARGPVFNSSTARDKRKGARLGTEERAGIDSAHGTDSNCKSWWFRGWTTYWPMHSSNCAIADGILPADWLLRRQSNGNAMHDALSLDERR